MSWPQYGQRFHPSGYVRLQDVQRIDLGSGIANRRALYTSGVDDDRRRTLLALLHLAEGDSPSACWDDRRAIELLRREATREDLRELGVGEGMIEHIFAEEHVC